MNLQHQLWLACLWEAQSRKPGNVHPGAAFADVSFSDFAASAGAVAASLGRERSTFGKSIYDAVAVTRMIVGKNTNLGICLLLEPLARVKNCRDVGQVLARLTRDDARRVFAAIEKANPGGLGTAPQEDVRDEPKGTLLEAMKLAADRDLIARQYANNYADVFNLGVPALLEGFKIFGCVEAAIIHCQLAWMAAFADSLIARKNGIIIAEDVQNLVKSIIDLGGLATPEGRASGVALDAHLRSHGNKLNPGATADLVAACLFVALREGKLKINALFPWQVEDWL